MKVRILRSALEDLSNGRRFYGRRAQRSAHIFSIAYFRDRFLVLYAGIPKIHLGHHRLLARRFPFAIYYRVIADEAVVFRVLDCDGIRWIRKALEKSANRVAVVISYRPTPPGVQVRPSLKLWRARRPSRKPTARRSRTGRFRSGYFGSASRHG